MRWFSVCAALCALAAPVLGLDPVSASGSKFFNKDGSQFYIKGIAYQLTDDDPLADSTQCGLDVKLMQELGANALRVYHVDSTANHDGCMNTFADAGIYLLIDLDTFDSYITPDDLYWNRTQYDAYAKVMDAFQGYDNTLAFFVGNEVIAKQTDSPAAPFVKAAARDMKAYRDSKGYRDIPVGYSAADIKQLRPMLQDYLTCGGNSSDNVDFFGINSYSWCGASNYNISTYDQLESQGQNFPVPIFLTETGCNVPEPRDFADQEAIFGNEMVNSFSGAIIYEWIEETNNFGLISYGPPAPDSDATDVVAGFTRQGTPTPIAPDFTNLQSRWATLTPTGISSSDYNPDSVSTRACPSSTPGGWWQVDGNVKLPTMGESVGELVTYTTMPSATAATTHSTTATATSTSTSTSSSSKDSGSGKGAGASLDQRAAVVGATLVGVIVGFCLLL